MKVNKHYFKFSDQNLRIGISIHITNKKIKCYLSNIDDGSKLFLERLIDAKNIGHYGSYNYLFEISSESDLKLLIENFHFIKPISST